jgi:hypothetical protein
MTRRLVLALVMAFVLAGCGGVPRPRSEVHLQQSAKEAEVDAILEHYREVRNAAIGLSDPKPLSIVEGGAMLAIETGLFEVAQRLSRTQGEEGRRLKVRSVETPSFTRYPLWFMVSAYDPAARLDVAQIFERTTPVDPWLLVDAPQMIPTTPLPGLRHDGDGKAIAVAASNGKGMSMSPQAAATAYAKALSSATGTAPPVARDGFMSNIRTSFDQVNRLEGVTVTQEWAPERVKHALRTNDGGALVWVTFLRLDSYSVDPGIKVSWPEGSPQQAFLADGISGTGKLRYYYQVLLQLPGGSGEPRAIGQYGGVISGESQPSLSPLPVPNLGAPSDTGAEPFPGVTLTPTPAPSPGGVTLRDRLTSPQQADPSEDAEKKADGTSE